MAQAVAVATPCCPAPVSAMMRFFPRRLARKDLAHGVIDLVCAGMSEVLALDPYLGSAQLPAKVGGVVEGGWTAHVVGEEVGKLFPKRGIFASGTIRILEFSKRGHQRFGYELAAVSTKTPECVGDIALYRG